MKLQAPSFKQDKKAIVCQDLESTVHFMVAMENAINPWYQMFHK